MLIDFKKASLTEVLKHKTMYYDKIDFTIVQESFKLIKQHIKLPFVIHIVGTNGKGSTGRFLAYYLHKKAYKTLHYSSPHILKFNERVWINGSESTDQQLQNASSKLQEILSENLLQKLTYFEYTTLLSFILSDGLDFLVLEAGLGGEFDATNVVKNDLSLITTIGLDHQSFLGNTIEQIAKTKMRSVDTKMLIGYQTSNIVYETALKVQKQLKQEFNKDIEIKKIENFEKYSLNKNFASYLKLNLHLVIEAIKHLNIDDKLDLEIFNEVKLFGRCEKIAKNITIDVGHNPLAAYFLANEFKNKKVHLIYNSYKDKDYEGVLKVLKPIISKITILELNDDRIVSKASLLEVCKKLSIPTTTFQAIENNEEYLVFGSFLVVEKFLNDMRIYEK